MRSYYALLQYEFMETGKINNTYLNDWDGAGKSGLTSFQLSGQGIKLKAGSIWVAPYKLDGSAGYCISYACNEPHHPDCILILPMS